eukprot:1161974-Pelagomonas_calceolata.AAC.10
MVLQQRVLSRVIQFLSITPISLAASACKTLLPGAACGSYGCHPIQLTLTLISPAAKTCAVLLQLWVSSFALSSLRVLIKVLASAACSHPHLSSSKNLCSAVAALGDILCECVLFHKQTISSGTCSPSSLQQQAPMQSCCSSG